MTGGDHPVTSRHLPSLPVTSPRHLPAPPPYLPQGTGHRKGVCARPWGPDGEDTGKELSTRTTWTGLPPQTTTGAPENTGLAGGKKKMIEFAQSG